MSSSDCPYFSETAPVCDDGECGCLECMERIADQMVDEDDDGRLLTMSEEEYYKEVLARYVKQSEKP